MFCPFYLSSCRALTSWPLSPPVSIVFLRIMVSVLRPDSYDIFWTVLIPGDRTWIFELFTEFLTLDILVRVLLQ